MSYVIAVDPGLTGAVAVLHQQGQLIEVFDMPTLDVGGGFVKREVDAVSLAFKLEQHIGRAARVGDIVNAKAVVERVTAMPGQGTTTMLSLGDSRGCARGVLGALGIRFSEVLPQTWKKALGLLQPRPKGSGKMTQQEKNQRQAKAKADSLDMAKRLFPGFGHLLQRAKDHGRAEAMLIGHWATTAGAA